MTHTTGRELADVVCISEAIYRFNAPTDTSENYFGNPALLQDNLSGFSFR